jgi:hypothetical protein
MARKTALKWCVKCDEKAQLGVYTGFYGLADDAEVPADGEQRHPQLTGTLPSRGFCADCFRKCAKGQGWDSTVLKKLKEKLQRR